MRDTNYLRLLGLLLLLSFILSACGGNTSEETAPPPVEGPALVMFYTDN